MNESGGDAEFIAVTDEGVAAGGVVVEADPVDDEDGSSA